MSAEIIKVYDEKGHTVLKKRILRHLGVGKGGLILAVLRSDGTVVLRPLRREDLLARLGSPEREDEVLRERVKTRYDLA
ncbi:MAG TPA: hypothetical protein ENG30_02470 [Thermofilaceae archaeon]|nr:MAG: hypothetical protein DRJ43_06800 [Thermoprotei archaeon]HDD33997.1 hypothetical protein [Thermofilaceae archaeon]